MALKNKEYIQLIKAWNKTTGEPVTGDAANITVNLIQNGVRAAASGSVAEVDSTNCPGDYKITITAAERNYDSFGINVKSSTASILCRTSGELTADIALSTGTKGTDSIYDSLLTKQDIVDALAGYTPAISAVSGSPEYILEHIYAEMALETTVEALSGSMQILPTGTDGYVLMSTDSIPAIVSGVDASEVLLKVNTIIDGTKTTTDTLKAVLAMSSGKFTKSGNTFTLYDQNNVAFLSFNIDSTGRTPL